MASESLKLKPVGANKYGGEEGDESSPISSNEDYDPHLHRNTDNPTSNTETLIHLLKGCLGTGILAMPEAFKNAGLLNGFVSTILIGALCTYCLHVLINTQYTLCRRMRVPILTYPESMKMALEQGPKCLRRFAGISPVIVDIFLVSYQFGICCVYIVFVAKNVRYTLTPVMGEHHVALYVLMFLVPFILINCVRNLKLLAPFSTLANVITLASFGIVCYYVFQDLPPVSERPAFGTAFAYPLFFGTTLFALEAVGVVIALENNMKTPKNFVGYCGVLNIGMIVVVFFYVGLGFVGYWKYGEKTKDTITVNFEPDDALAKSVRLLYSLAIFISYGLQGYVPVDILWKTYIVKHLQDATNKKQLFYEYLLRVGSVIFTSALAASIPLLGLFISLFGAFCLSALGLAFPALMECCVKYPDNLGRYKWVLIKDILLIIFGIIGLLAGSYSCLSEIIRKLSAGELE